MERIDIFRDELRYGVVAFIFKKKDGSLRYAFGTTSNLVLEKYIPDYDPKKEKVDRGNTVLYYDLQRKGWRSFNIDQLCVYDEVENITLFVEE